MTQKTASTSTPEASAATPESSTVKSKQASAKKAPAAKGKTTSTATKPKAPAKPKKTSAESTATEPAAAKTAKTSTAKAPAKTQKAEKSTTPATAEKKAPAKAATPKTPRTPATKQPADSNAAKEKKISAAEKPASESTTKPAKPAAPKKTTPARGTAPAKDTAQTALGKTTENTVAQDKAPAKSRPARGRARPAAPKTETTTNREPQTAPQPLQAETQPPANPAEQEAGSTQTKEKSRGRRGQRKRPPKKDTAPAQQQDSPWETVDSFLDADMDMGASESAKANNDAEEENTKEGRNRGKRKDTRPQQEESPEKSTRRKMFVSIVPEEQVEVVLTVEGQVNEYYVEMLHQAKTKGNIYKGVINNIDANLQAAFVNYGAVKNGFLQIDEVHPEYFGAPHETGRNHKYPPIQKVLKPGQEVLVQVVKEPTGTKGAFLTTYLSLAGRFLVLTPGREQIGVSRKVDNDTERARLREMLNGLTPGPGLGVIVRTVSIGASKTSLESDLAYLKRIWGDIRTNGIEAPVPSLIYQELDLGTRAVRDYLTDDVVEVWLDDPSAGKGIADLVKNLFPRKKNLLRLHQENSALFERFNLQRQLEQIHSREVVLPSGGRLVIDPTEALTAIDINSGRSSGKSNFEDMAYRTNLEAARMIPLQLRLRDIGGQVVVDFIEMRDKNHWREVEKAMRNGMKVDRARYDVGRISSFGMMEIVRQRLGSSAISISTEPCPYCRGTGVRRNMEWQCQQALREIASILRETKPQEKSTTVLYEAEADVALYLLNFKRQRLLEMEQANAVHIEIKPK